MTWDERKSLIKEVEAERKGRTLIALLNFDRPSDDPRLGLSMNFNAEMKEALFRVLKESLTKEKGSKGKGSKEKASMGIDLFLYTRGGDTNGVWPIISLIREFDRDFEVLAPFRCHSAGTLLSLGAKKIWMTPLSELSPIDPTTGNQFNPQDAKGNLLGISVEDVNAFGEFVKHQGADDIRQLEGFISKLVDRVHPLALGNVHRVHRQIQKLAKEILSLHPVKGRNDETVIKRLTSEFNSHLHMIGREQAKEILGSQVEAADAKLSAALDALLRSYEDAFRLRQAFVVRGHLGEETMKDVTFVGGVVESHTWSYLFKTKGRLHQFSALPQGVQVQIPMGQGMPLIAGLPREHRFEIFSQAWQHNTKPQGVTV